MLPGQADLEIERGSVFPERVLLALPLEVDVNDAHQG